MREGEQESYQYTLSKAKEAGDEEAINLLEKMGPPSGWEGFQNVPVQRQLLAKYGGSFVNISYRDLMLYWNSSPYYQEDDNTSLIKASAISQSILWEELMQVDFFDEVFSLEVPVYFFMGRHDYQTPFSILERYFNSLEAPSKRIIWFENSGHTPNLDEPDIYQDKLINEVLKNAMNELTK